MTEFKCTKCGFQREVLDKYVGKSVRCPECKAPNRVSKSAPKRETEPSEAYKFNCPHCNQKIRLKKKYAGRRLKCTKCEKVIQAPEISDAAPELKLADPTDVLRVGQDQPLDAGAGGMNMDDLMQFEAQSPAVDIPSPHSVEQTPQDAKGGAPKPRSRKDGASGKSKMPMIIGIVVVVVVAMIGIGMMVGSSGGSDTSKSDTSKKKVDFEPLKEFSESYIYMLGDSKLDQAWELLADEAQEATTDPQFEAVAEMIDSKEIVEMACRMTHFESTPEELYYLMYSVRYTNESGDENRPSGRNVAIVLQVSGDDIRVSDFGVREKDGFESADLGLRPYDELSVVALEAKLSGVLAVMKKIGFRRLAGIVVALLIFRIIVLYKIFDKAGEPGWAVFVPFYGDWVYACVADQPGWVGLAPSFIGGIPGVGPFATIGIWLYLTFNVGIALGRGVAFSLGLCFLPFIFFPILAFTD
ncbi:MAG: hypothetical protein KAJ07_09190 [Planctomycetes bacterium]|nr:hypothetical protein [Planctomycetota bacterium]